MISSISHLASVLRDSDECLSSTPNWGPNDKCEGSESMCEDKPGSWAKDVRRCCPELCGTGILTKDMCEALVSRGTCTYPNAAQGSGEGKSNLGVDLKKSFKGDFKSIYITIDFFSIFILA